MLDPAVCHKARLARDPRFDGRFFTGVLTTGIYCRPVCPAPPAKDKNVRFYPSAAAAAEAGLRPCLRCRPETSPGTPAWNGASTTVTRALRLIAEGALDHGSVEALAGRLGIGSRHLRRLFLEHLGAAPVSIAQIQRIQFAKRLIDATTLPFTEVALASGFGSVRRFQSVVEGTYGRTPTELRQLARRNGETNLSGDVREYVLDLPFRPPFDWQALLDFLRPRAIPFIETVGPSSYQRRFQLDGQAGWIEATPAGTALRLTIGYPNARHLFGIVERARRLFDLAADPAAIGQHLGSDPALGPRIQQRPGLRVPGAWDPFETSVRAILGQQVSVKGATTLSGRLVERLGGGVFPSPEALAEADIASIGLPARRAEAIREFARAAAAGVIDFSGAAGPAQFREVLTSLPGIGPWTAHYISMRVLNDPDAFPSSDLGLLKSSGAASPAQLEAASGAWRPWRAYAALYLWQVTI
ncbi:MAG: AlkA N-terminal domain-containing protein [Bryobacteraceae bacterium]|nr:AlkA N-terminal domain-containing protein [Bryobacteraceae bacterium]